MAQFRAHSPDGVHALDHHFLDLRDWLQIDEFVTAYRTTGALQDDDIEKLSSKMTSRNEKLSELVAIAKRRDLHLNNFVKALSVSIERLEAKQHKRLLNMLSTTLEDNHNRRCGGSDSSGLSRSLSRLSLLEQSVNRTIDIENHFTKICCIGCNGEISCTESMREFKINSNPHGYQHKYYILSGISTKAQFQYSGEWTAEHSWFEGYRWRILHCGKCGERVHWGWQFQATNNSTPHSFFGIRQDAICLLH